MMSSPLTPPASPMLKGEPSLLLPKAKSAYQSLRHLCHRSSQTLLASTVDMRSWIPNSSRKQNQQLRPTAYLDGLRGFAAVLVYIMHHEIWAHDPIQGVTIFENAFGYQGRHYFTQLPGIRLFFAGGHLAVAIFFIISGYVLAAKPMAFLQDRNITKLSENLASALFRRWIRLYIPIFATTFIYMTLAYVIQGLETTIQPGPRYFDEIQRWYIEVKNFSFVFRNGGVPWMVYNFHTWTIPLEFKGSMIVYTSLLTFSQCTRKARLFLQVGLMYYFMYIVDGWYGSCFIAGMLLVDLDLLAERGELPAFITNLKQYKKSIMYTLFAIALYLGGVPCSGNEIDPIRDAPGWHYLSYLRPSAVFMPKQFYLFWAAFCLVIVVPRLGWLKAFFEHPINQYFGKISYAFYLVHGPILWTIGNRIYAAVGWVGEENTMNISRWIGAFRLPSWGPVGLEVNFLFAQLLLFPLTLWIAKLATDAFDGPAIKLASWTYERVCVKDDEQEKYPV
jgi:peptidoglycan/LPS O-acetylase OafA/YrhL